MPQLKYKHTEKTIMAWASQYDSLQVYLSRLNGRRERAALSVFDFCDWAGKTPDELITLKNGFENLDAEKLLDRFVISQLAIPDSRKWQAVNAVKGFYRANYRQLQSQAGKMEYVQIRPQRLPTKRQRLALYKAAYNPRDRALVLVACCSGIARETLSNLCWTHFEEDWQKQDVPHVSIGPELLKGHNHGKYRGVRQETFLTPEAKRALIDYRDWFAKTFLYRWREDNHVFLSVRDNVGEPLTMNGACRTIGLLVDRSGVKFGIHDGRRIVETALENVSCPRNWVQKVKGRKVRGEDAPYSKPAIEQLRKKYREALPELMFLDVEHAAAAEERQENAVKELQQEIVELKRVVGQLVSQTMQPGMVREQVDEQIKSRKRMRMN